MEGAGLTFTSICSPDYVVTAISAISNGNVYKSYVEHFVTTTCSCVSYGDTVLTTTSQTAYEDGSRSMGANEGICRPTGRPCVTCISVTPVGFSVFIGDSAFAGLNGTVRRNGGCLPYVCEAAAVACSRDRALCCRCLLFVGYAAVALLKGLHVGSFTGGVTYNGISRNATVIHRG